MITDYTLRTWRSEALEFKENVKDMTPENKPVMELIDRILLMTQELLRMKSRRPI